MNHTNKPTAYNLHFGQRIIYAYEGRQQQAEVIGRTQRTLIVRNTEAPRFARAISPARVTEIFND